MTIIQGLDGQYIVDGGKLIKVVKLTYAVGYLEIALEDGRTFKMANVNA